IICSTRNNSNIFTIVQRNKSQGGLNVTADKGTLSGLKAPKKQRTSFATGALLLSVPVLTFCLGTWQVRRREWKLKLMEDLEWKTKQPPIELPE
ncbi:cytochrome oxidase assembly protein shy1-like, partial [Nilaparvata lugens]|uniref:cytochrome oxidase assembly protein shy1-like n=1 Tax=Nilaparvata lugens TaxID=108931 RepID=UPI00193DFB85